MLFIFRSIIKKEKECCNKFSQNWMLPYGPKKPVSEVTRNDKQGYRAEFHLNRFKRITVSNIQYAILSLSKERKKI